MTIEAGNDQLQRLLQLWRGLGDDRRAPIGLTDLTSRDLSFFHRILKDSFVIRGMERGPFNIAFVGTDLEGLFGRKLHNTPLGSGFPVAETVRLEEAFSEMAQTRRPMLMAAELTSPRRSDRLAGQILCVPLAGEAYASAYSGHDETVTIFGLFALAGSGVLAPEPTHPRMEITDFTAL
jgi:hypothetical protein